jgi:hypothetical protein
MGIIPIAIPDLPGTGMGPRVRRPPDSHRGFRTFKLVPVGASVGLSLRLG